MKMKFYVEKSDWKKYLEDGIPPRLFSEEEVQQRLRNLKEAGKLEDGFVLKDHFVLMELTPPVEKTIFPIGIAVFGKEKIGGVRGERFYFATKEEAVLNRLNIDPFWFKVLEAIKDMKFTRLISVTLNADGCYPAIGVMQIGDSLFSYVNADNFVLFPGQKFAYTVESATNSIIRNEFVSGLKDFLEKIPEKKNIMGSTHVLTGQRLFQTFFCPKPSDIQVVSEEEKQ